MNLTEEGSSTAVSELAQFVRTLTVEGRAEVSSHPLGESGEDTRRVLSHLDRQARAELGLEPPPFSAEAAMWATRLFYQLCQSTVCRDLPEERIRAVCRVRCPEPRLPATDWSSDLVLRHLPKLFQLARHLCNADPLLDELKQIAITWPLSSVGMAGLSGLALDSFIGHPALRRLYADRIMASGDTSRLGDPRMDDMLRADLGMHRELSPTLATTLCDSRL